MRTFSPDLGKLWTLKTISLTLASEQCSSVSNEDNEMARNKDCQIASCYCNPKWIENLRQLSKENGGKLDEVNCWLESNTKSHLPMGTPFLFRTTKDKEEGKVPECIVGGGYFHQSERCIKHSTIWKNFEEKSGAYSLKELRGMLSHKDRKYASSQVIKNPFFLDEEYWICLDETKIGSVKRAPRRYYRYNEPETRELIEKITQKKCKEMKALINFKT